MKLYSILSLAALFFLKAISRPVANVSSQSCLACPRGCSCSFRRLHTSPWIVNCSRAKLSRLPVEISPAVQILDLSYNEFTSSDFSEPSQPLQRLSWLSLQSSKVSYLTWNFLCSFPRLAKVFLHDNKGMLITNHNIKCSTKSLEHLSLDAETAVNLIYLPEGTTFLEIHAGDEFLSWDLVWKVSRYAPTLKKLSVHGLSLKRVPMQLFRTFPELIFLSLQKCNISNLKDLEKERFKTKTRTFHLDISYNNIRNISFDMFNIFKNVRNLSLDLSYNKISYISKSSFRSIKRLHLLNLSHNNLGVDNFERLLVAVSHLKLYEMKVAKCNIESKAMTKESLEHLKNTDIKRFDMSENRFILLATDNYYYMPKVEFIASGVFVYAEPDSKSEGSHLKEVHLSHMAGDTGWQIITLSNSFGVSNIEKVKIIQWSSALRPHEIFTFPRYEKLLELELFSVACGEGLNFSKLHSLETLRMTGVDCATHQIKLGHNTSIKHFMYRRSERTLYLSEIIDTWVAKLQLVEILDLSENFIRFSPGSTDTAPFASLQELRELCLAKTGLSTVSNLFRNLSKLQILDISHNRIDTLPLNMLRESKHLKELHLQGNALYAINADLFLSMTELIYLDITDNMIMCECSLRKFVSWILDLEFKSYYSNNQSCEDGNLLYVSGRQDNCVVKDKTIPFSGTLMDYEINWIYCDNNLYKLSIVASTLCLLVIGTMTYIVYQYQTTLFILWRRFSYVMCRPPAKGYAYDCYVSYCDKDFKFVEALQKEMETEPSNCILQQLLFKLCIRDRDFLPGEAIIDNIVTSMESSRAALFILTAAALKDVWCQFEAEYGVWSLVISQRKELIVVFLEELPDSDMCISLKSLVRHAEVVDGFSSATEDMWLNIRAALCRKQSARCLKLCPKSEF